MNPYIIIAAIIALAGAFFGGERIGHRNGVNQQKVADQAQFDKVNTDLAKQKAEAARLYEQAQKDIITKQTAEAEFKTQLEKQRAQANTTITALRRDYDARSLRFTIKDPGCRAGGGDSSATQGNPASPATTTEVQLPDSIARNLRQLVEDADSLKIEYQACYDWANR